MERLFIKILFFICFISLGQSNYNECINSYIYTLNGDRYGCWTSLHKDWCKVYWVEGEWDYKPFTILMFDTFEECCVEASTGFNEYDKSNCNCTESKEKKFEDQDWISDLEDSYGEILWREIEVAPYVLLEFKSYKYKYIKDY